MNNLIKIKEELDRCGIDEAQRDRKVWREEARMSALTAGNSRWAIVNIVSAWWRRAMSAPDIHAQESGATSAALAEHFPRSSTQLLSLSNQGLHGSNLLERRMAALKLEPKVLAREEPDLFRGLQRLCTGCLSPRRCARDLMQELGRDPTEESSGAWREYCPNASTLHMLSTLESCSPPHRDRSFHDITFERMIYLSGMRQD
jgi:hypothetical protein